MVKSYTKTIGVFAAITTISILSLAPAFADETNNTNFNVNVKEALSVSVTTPTNWAAGDIDDFLRNKVSISVTSNNSAGFTASMTTKTTDTSLTNSSKNTYTLPTLAASAARSSFPANYWGYSFDDTETGNSNSTYAALVGLGSTPITILSSTSATTGSKDFYFGAKADVTQAAGTYTGTVVINVVSGVIDNTTNPVTPTNPATPGTTDNAAAYTPAPTGSTASGSTTYTYRRTNSGSGSGDNTETTTTEVSEGDNTDAYVSYTPPQGETYRTTSNIATNSAIATGLAITSAAAAASGIFLFVVAKRDKDDDEEEQ